MAAYIFDASAIVKRVEVIAALSRRRERGHAPSSTTAAILSAFRYDAAHQYNILEINAPLLNEAERLAEKHRLRGYDAVQLAATLILHRTRNTAGLSGLTFLSADDELNTGALAVNRIDFTVRTPSPWLRIVNIP